MAGTNYEGTARGKVVVITGASSGLGLETAKQLARQGAEIVMVVRDQTRGEQARTQFARIATGRPPCWCSPTCRFKPRYTARRTRSKPATTAWTSLSTTPATRSTPATKAPTP